MHTINIDIPIYGIKCVINLHVAAYLPADARLHTLQSILYVYLRK